MFIGHRELGVISKVEMGEILELSLYGAYVSF
jgi:hypothetical protein